MRFKRRIVEGTVKIPAWEMWAVKYHPEDYAELSRFRSSASNLESILKEIYRISAQAQNAAAKARQLNLFEENNSKQD